MATGLMCAIWSEEPLHVMIWVDAARAEARRRGDRFRESYQDHLRAAKIAGPLASCTGFPELPRKGPW